MQDRIEPPILLSRLMLFVFAGMAVVLFVMLMTLEKMFPLERPQVFFITTKPQSSAIIQVAELPPDNDNLDAYKMAFVMEYVRARNEIQKNTSIMRQKWGNLNGVIETWSTPTVYADFRKLGLVNALDKDYPDFEFTCPVKFKGRPLQLAPNQYTVKFEYYCEDSNGQTAKKDYTIQVGLQVANNPKLKWTERLNNPLGIKVSKYVVEGGGADPLEMVYKQ